MNDVDLNVYRHAQALANSGQMSLALQMFRELRSHNSDIEILFAIATTTPNPVEAREMIDMIRNLQPYHPQLAQLETLHKQKIQGAYTADPIGPTLLCPYCQQRTPARIKSRISTGGWVWFAVFFMIFLCFLWAPTTADNMKNMEIAAFFFLGVGIVGMLLIHKRIYICGSCGSKITDAH
ncbi:hypothetical protein KSF_088500 [Reticulibacter mediterranei]|uniref:LITAF domain-containing protein n=1 Tax=Reticulibacter mediterranei TaxID=2778369 RepID=A0A8J3IXW4_9CHLR|nr:LITAF-like zinc ribbon domain-containing protein [Reticulibacter mediterranei]GHO98802.1 hypothetical protein KSF_088500 [Reticulibacter mediterranei]